jgi:hypothetical protein
LDSFIPFSGPVYPGDSLHRSLDSSGSVRCAGTIGAVGVEV